MVRKIGMISLVTSIIIVSLLLSGCTEISDEGGEDFVFTDIDGNIWQLSDFKGKVVIMDLWATWCGPCSAQMTELKELYDDYPRDELEILSINIDPNESFQNIQDYIDSAKEFGHEFKWIFGNDDGSIWEVYQIDGGIPTLYIFDQNGNIYYSDTGYMDYSTLSAKINGLLE